MNKFARLCLSTSLILPWTWCSILSCTFFFFLAQVFLPFFSMLKQCHLFWLYLPWVLLIHKVSLIFDQPNYLPFLSSFFVSFLCIDRKLLYLVFYIIYLAFCNFNFGLHFIRIEFWFHNFIFSLPEFNSYMSVSLSISEPQVSPFSSISFLLQKAHTA